MPPGGVESRSEQLALVAGLLHDRGTDPRLGELLAAVEGSELLADPGAPAAVNVRELRREYDRFVRLPRKLVEEVARTTTLAQKAWASARGAADFERFRPWLERIVRLKQDEAECVGYDGEPLRRAAGGLRAGTSERGGGAAVRRPRAGAGAAARPHRRRAPPARPVRAPTALPARPAAPLRGDAWRRPSDSTSGGAAWTSASIPRAPPSARATAGSASASTTATSPAACSPSSTRSATGCTSRAWTPSTTALRSARRRRSAWTRRRRGSGRTAVGREPRILGALLSPCARALPREPGRRAAGRVPLRGEPRDAVAASGCRRTR